MSKEVTTNQISEKEQLQRVEELLSASAARTLLRFSTAGSVDDGKSTLIGRLLHDSKNIYEDHLQALAKASERGTTGGALELAYLTDGLKAEREQGITIDVAYRYFSTPKRHFILADTPGHEQYTRNMATGASNARLSVILIDARNGVVTQTKRHAFIASLLGIPRFLIAVNKMDLVDYSEQVFEKIRQDFVDFAAKLDVKELRFIPVAALPGDNIVHPSKNMPWYHGETVMDYLEDVYVSSDTNLVDFRFPVQLVFRPSGTFRGYAGQITSGLVRVGDEILVLPSQRRSHVKTIEVFNTDPKKRQLEEAFAPMSVVLTLEDEIDISRGDMLVRANNVPPIRTQFEAMVVWMSERPLELARPYLIRHTTREAKAFIDAVRYKVDVNTLSRFSGGPLALNEIGRLAFTSAKPLFMDPYSRNRGTGSFVLIHPESFLTVGAGMVIDRLPEEYLRIEKGPSQVEGIPSKQTSEHIHKEDGFIGKVDRERRLGARALTVWLTGLSGSGKSTLAKILERRMFADNRLVYRLDGDNLRFGLNRDLGFSDEDRRENIRRVAEVARLLNQAGVTVICSLISPFKQDRENARQIVGPSDFVEVFVSTPLAVCEQRDARGLYKRARTGEIREFTGISSPYEVPGQPNLVVDTSAGTPEECAGRIEEYLKRNYESAR